MHGTTVLLIKYCELLALIEVGVLGIITVGAATDVYTVHGTESAVKDILMTVSH